MRRLYPFLVSILVLLAAAGCGGSPANPTGVPGATTPPFIVSPPEATQLQGMTGAVTSAPVAATTPTSVAAPTAAAPTQVVPLSNPVNLPPGFGISTFQSGLRGPRMMALGPDGQLYVAERGASRIVRLPDRNGDGVSDGVEIVADGMNAPSSIAFYQDGSLYVGETGQIVRLSQPDAQGVFQQRDVIIPGLPTSGSHSTRTVLFSPDWKTLYVSIGSSCNVCNESDERRAAIMRFNPDGSGGEIYARGLRNAVGLAIRPGTDELWATNNGRDLLGDDLPPDTIQVVHTGDDFGWPRCHAGDIVDPEFGSPGACDNVAQPAVKLQAHSAPLGLTFYTGHQFPGDYSGSLFVAFHGSWNRTVPTGYKVVRIPMQGGQPGQVEDFATGWLTEGGTPWGRPVDVLAAPDGSLWVSDDAAGMIYRIFYRGQ